MPNRFVFPFLTAINRRFAALLFLLLATTSLHAQNEAAPPLRFDHIQSELGLSQNNITCVPQDHKGFLRLGTYAGLYRLRGREASMAGDAEIVSFHQPMPKEIDQTVAYKIFEDREGAICEDPFEPEKHLRLGTAGGGLNRFDLATGQFAHFAPKNGLPNMATLRDSERWARQPMDEHQSWAVALRSARARVLEFRRARWFAGQRVQCRCLCQARQR